MSKIDNGMSIKIKVVLQKMRVKKDIVQDFGQFQEVKFCLKVKGKMEVNSGQIRGRI